MEYGVFQGLCIMVVAGAAAIGFTVWFMRQW